MQATTSQIEALLWREFPYLVRRKQNVLESIDGIVNQLQGEGGVICSAHYGYSGESAAVKSMAYYKAGVDQAGMKYAIQAIMEKYGYDWFQTDPIRPANNCIDDYYKLPHVIDRAVCYIKSRF